MQNGAVDAVAAVRAVAGHVAEELFAAKRVVVVQLFAPAGFSVVAADRVAPARVAAALVAGCVGHARVVAAEPHYCARPGY